MSVRYLSALVLLCACAPSIAFVKTNRSPRELASRPVSEVEVYRTTVPDRPYAEVGIVTAETSAADSSGTPWASMPTMIEALRTRAAQEGCDAIVLGPSGSYAYQATCVVFR
jgi:hypothetical protein